MTRLIGPSNADRFAYTIVTSTGSMRNVIKGKPLAAATFYDDPDPTAEPTLDMLTSPADILTLAGDAISGGTVTIDAASQFPLIQFPDGDPVGPNSLLLRIGTGPAYRVYAREDDQIETAQATASSAAATGAGLAVVFGA